MNPAPRITSATLEGTAVVLRPVGVSDAEPAFRLIHGREEILRWLLWGGPKSVRDLEESFERWTRPFAEEETPREYLFAITERESNDFVGTIGLRFHDHPEVADVGYWLAEHVWCRGYATESIALSAYFAFRYLGTESVVAGVFVGNTGSRRALEKNGFALARTVYGKVERDGKTRDEWYFVLLRTEWERRSPDWRPHGEAVLAH